MENPEKYKIAVVGDVSLKCRSGNKHPFSTEIEIFFQSKSLVLVNLETVLADGGQQQQKAVILRVDPSMAKYLREVGVNAVNLANNHTFDYGIEGFHSTIVALEAAGIGYFGGLQQGVQLPYLHQVDDCNIGILGYTIGGTRNFDTGVAPLDEQQIQKDFASLKSRNVERVIVNLHWGEEYVTYPSPEQQRIARRVIDAGADVVIGHHPHVVQGIEPYKNGVIFYSLGNFNFMNSSKLDKRFPSTQWGLIALLNFSSPSSVEYECIPVQIDAEYRPIFARKEIVEAFLAYLKDISEPLKPQIKKLFWLREASWPHFCNHLPSFIRRIKKYGVRHFLQMLQWMLSPSNYAFYLGLFLMLIARILDRPLPEPVCPRPGV